MEILKYINNGFHYIPMVKRIEELEQKLGYIDGRVIYLDAMHNDWNKINLIDLATDSLINILYEIKPDIEYSKMERLKNQLRDVLK